MAEYSCPADSYQSRSMGRESAYSVPVGGGMEFLCVRSHSSAAVNNG